MKIIVHITTVDEWKKAVESGEYTASSLASEGFIHCSTIKQCINTADLFFKGQHGLAILCIDQDKVKAEIRYEDPTGSGHDPIAGSLFPHIYGPINLNAVVSVADFPPNDDGTFSLPEGVQKFI